MCVNLITAVILYWLTALLFLHVFGLHNYNVTWIKLLFFFFWNNLSPFLLSKVYQNGGFYGGKDIWSVHDYLFYGNEIWVTVMVHKELISWMWCSIFFFPNSGLATNKRRNSFNCIGEVVRIHHTEHNRYSLYKLPIFLLHHKLLCKYCLILWNL